MRVKASNGAFDGFKAAPDLRAAMAMPPAAHGAGAGKVGRGGGSSVCCLRARARD